MGRADEPATMPMWITKKRVERWIERMDKPLLALSVLTLVLYLLHLQGLVGFEQTVWYFVILIIDLLFVVDLIAKLWVYGTAYLQTPWFLIDLISCLPLLDALAGNVRAVRTTRFVRVFRFLRILRGLRLLRMLRTLPAYEALIKDSPQTRDDKRLHRLMNAGLVGMTVVVLALIVFSRRKIELDYVKQIDRQTAGGVSLRMLEVLGGSLKPPGDDDPYLERTLKVDDKVQTVYFDMEVVEARSDEFEFFLILGMMLSMLFLMYIIAYHQLDITQAQLRALLNLALPRQVAERFVVDATAYNQKSRTPAAVIFMDFVGFTRVCEELSPDPDRLSAHLEAAMDRLVGELIRHDMIIDKFIGDAIMSFRGGPLVGGDLSEHAYRAVRAALDSIKALSSLKDPFFHRIKIGGTASDDCLIGAFGTSARLSYTILGDGVNLAARLEPASAQCGTQNLFCENTFRVTAQRPDLVWRRWGRIRVVGKATPLNVYEVFDAAELGDSTFVATFHRALESFEHNDFRQARELFLLASAQRPGADVPSLGYVEWCEKLLEGGPPSGWEPVFDTHK
jgi:adenylate cyclase